MTARPSHPRWLARILGLLLAWATLTVVRAQTAIAATVTAEEDSQTRPPPWIDTQTPAALRWIELTDARGISIWNYEMSLDRGSVVAPDKFLWASVTDVCWGIYRSWCALALWFLDWVLSFSWVSTVATPLMEVGDAMQSVVARIGVVPAFLTVSALMAMLWMFKGRHTTAIWEIGIACVVAALASGVFAQPVRMIAGPEGYIVKANQAGQELAAELATGDSEGKTPEQLRLAQAGQLVDTFIRQPTQMINFGRAIDGTKCESTYTAVVKAGPYGNGADIRNEMASCDEALGEYAGNPSHSMALGSMVFIPAAFVILFMALVLAGSVIAAAIWAMFLGVKAIVALVMGLLPGGGRGSLMLTASETIVALGIVIFTSVFLSVFLLVIQALFAAADQDSIGRTFVIVDILIVVGTLVFWRQRQQLKAASQRLAQLMTQRPGGAPATRMPDRQPGLPLGGAAAAVRTATGIAHWRSARAAANRPPGSTMLVDARQQAMFIGGFPSGPNRVVDDVDVKRAAARPQLPPGPDHPQLPAGPDGQPPAGGGGGPRHPRRRSAGRQMAGRLVRAGTSAALAYATGGASTAVTGAAKLATVSKSARRAALAARMAQSARRSAAPSGAGSRVIPGTVISSSLSSGDPRLDHGHAARLPSGGRPAATPTPGRPPRRTYPIPRTPEVLVMPLTSQGKGLLAWAGKANRASGKVPGRISNEQQAREGGEA